MREKKTNHNKFLDSGPILFSLFKSIVSFLFLILILSSNTWRKASQRMKLNWVISQKKKIFASTWLYARVSGLSFSCYAIFFSSFSFVNIYAANGNTNSEMIFFSLIFTVCLSNARLSGTGVMLTKSNIGMFACLWWRRLQDGIYSSRWRYRLKAMRKSN